MGPPSHLAPLKKARSVVFEREKIETVLFSILFYIWKHYHQRCFVSEDRLPRIMVFPNRLVPIDQWPSQFKTSPEPHSEHILRKCQFFPFVFFRVVSIPTKVQGNKGIYYLFLRSLTNHIRQENAAITPNFITGAVHIYTILAGQNNILRNIYNLSWHESWHQVWLCVILWIKLHTLAKFSFW